MIQYQGSNIYKFWNEKNETLLLSQADIETISDFAEKDPDFTNGEKLMDMKCDRDFWKENYKELCLDIKSVYDNVSHRL